MERDSWSKLPMLIAFGKILLDWSTNFLLPLVDEFTDLVSGIRYIRDGDIFFGTMTLALPIAPAIGATMIKISEEGINLCYVTFFKHLPIIQLWTHIKMLVDITKHHIRIQTVDDQTAETQNKISLYEKSINEIKTKLQSFKIFTGMLESAPQFILQISILFKRHYIGEDPDWTDTIFLLQTTSSIGSVYMTVTGLLCEMAVIVHATERPPERSFSFTYGKILPLIIFVVTPRLMTMVAIGSFATLQDSTFYFTFGLAYICIFALSCYSIKLWIKRKYCFSNTCLINNGLLASFVAPCVLGIYDSNFLLITSVTTSVIHSLALGSICAVANHQPDLVFNSTKTDVEDNLYWFTFALLPLMYFTNLFVFWIQSLMKRNNSGFRPILAVDTGDTSYFDALTDEETDKCLSMVVPGDEENNSLLMYACQTNDQMASFLIGRSSKEQDLRQENEYDKTVLMLSCDKAHPKTVEALFKIAVSGKEIGIDQTSYYNDGNSAVHFAVLSNGPTEDKKKVLSLFELYANELEINFLICNKHGKTPFDILEKTQEGSALLKELQTPKAD